MARNGSGVYSLPAGSTLTPNTLADCNVLNSINNDIATDLNTPRPVVAGGTGANTVAGAQAVLGLTTGTFGLLYGLTLSNNASDVPNGIDIATGVAAEQGVSSPNLMKLNSVISKSVAVAWTAGGTPGAPLGGLDTGTVGNNTYHVWLIQRSDTLVVDALFSLSATAPTMPANYDRKRRIGSIIRTSATNRGFVQTGDEFLFKGNSVVDVSATNPGTVATARTLSVPVGLEIEAFIRYDIVNSGSAGLFDAYFSYLGVVPDLPATYRQSASPVANATGRSRESAGEVRVRTNSSAQIRSSHSYSDANCTLTLTAYGFRDDRGRV